MKLVTLGTRIKYRGQRYYPNVPFDLDVEAIPEELQGLVEEYAEKPELKKQFVSPRRRRNMTANKKATKKNTKAKETKEATAKAVEEKKTIVDDGYADLI